MSFFTLLKELITFKNPSVRLPVEAVPTRKVLPDEGDLPTASITDDFHY